MEKESIELSGGANEPKPNQKDVQPEGTVDKSVDLGKEPTANQGKRAIDKDNGQAEEAVDKSLDLGMNPVAINDVEYAKKVLEQETPNTALSEDIKSLLEGIELPQEFKIKALGLFEGAVTGRIADIKKEMMEANTVVMETYKKELAESLEESTDAYVAEAVAKWLEENHTQVKSNVRTQLAESFMANLLNLLESHYITIPEGKEDILESALAKADELQTQLTEALAESESLKESIKLKDKTLVIESCLVDLTDTQKERVKQLSESIAFDTVDSYKTKISAIVESLSKVKTTEPNLTQDILSEGEQPKETQPKVAMTMADKIVADMKRLGK